jgi:hypothetical protein
MWVHRDTDYRIYYTICLEHLQQYYLNICLNTHLFLY